MTVPAGGQLLPASWGVHRPPPSGVTWPAVTDPGLVLGGVLTVWVLVLEAGIPTKVSWVLLALCCAALLLTLSRNATRMRWSAPALLLLAVGACSTLSAARHGDLIDALEGVGGTVLLVGCALLAANCRRAEIDRLVVVVVVLALAECALAAASAFLGVPAPWGYLGRAGSLFGVNELVPALGGRATGTLGHPIPLGMLEAVGALLALFAARRWSWALRAPVAAVCGGGVLLSGSRSAAIVLVVAVAYGLLRPGTSRAGTLGQVVVLVAGAVAVLTVDVSDLPQLSSLVGTGSLDHRLGALQSIDDLSGRPTVEALFGSGSGALSSLFTEGLLQTDGFTAVDNQLVTTFALAGVVGVACLVGAVLVGLLLGDRTTRPAAVAAVLMFFSFDVLQWESSAVLAVVLLSLGVVRRTGAGADADEPGAGTALPDPRRPV
jgi:hypothetical protein